ncbi:patatin-like phospholipase family protein [Actinomadura decatromicini]|uniref:Patatin-like phospholipase family protein n=1 Tax=Actinomadura decatromicini TaxID=2604572 RepID=A0A5D3FMA2_9ACTN|nr:patatin-like phospholipase family protein [Actinomadura decatromicini]TYK49353.1 patatin-like phospholipase family protein [Actinomadura decatromicini]
MTDSGVTEHGRRNGWALVLGPGGPVGTAWLTGLAAGLRRAGLDPAAADVIVGTSAGAIAGALITTGRDLDALADLPPRDTPRPAPDGSAMAEALALGGSADLEPDEIRRRIGRLALAATALPAEQHRAGMRFLIGTDEWPAARLLVTGVDVESGTPVVWDAGSGVPLTAAVAASSAAPGYAEPVLIGGRPFMDGAFGGGSNAHLAAGAGRIVLIEPMPRSYGDAGADVQIVPDEAALEAFGGNVGDLTRWASVYREGFRQAADAAERISRVVGGPVGGAVGEPDA